MQSTFCFPVVQQGCPGSTSDKEPDCQCRRHKRYGFNPWVGKIFWRRVWQPTPVFLPGESHRPRNLVGCSPWGRKKSDMTEATQYAHTRSYAITKIPLLRRNWTLILGGKNDFHSFLEKEGMDHMVCFITSLLGGTYFAYPSNALAFLSLFRFCGVHLPSFLESHSELFSSHPHIIFQRGLLSPVLPVS